MPTKFDFASPGVELREVDQSTLQPIPPEDGLLLIGTSRKGPAMKPIKFNSYDNFEEIFGRPMIGKAGGDPWRDGQYGAASHAVYAAEAYLKSGLDKPLTFVRLAGLNGDGKKAGWLQTQTLDTVVQDYSGSYGLFVSEAGTAASGTLAAIFYVDGVSMGLNGNTPEGVAVTNKATTFITGSTTDVVLTLNNGTDTSEVSFNFGSGRDNIRKQFNTNASSLYSGTSIHEGKTFKYFLGESFEGAVNALDDTNGYYVWIAGLGDNNNNNNHADFQNELTPSKSGWFVGSKPNQKKLFRLVALEEGEAFQREHYTTVSDIVTPNEVSNPDASFKVSIWKVGQSSPIESFICNLNPFSPNFIGKKIGDTNQEWDYTTGRMNVSGDYLNVSSYVRVEVAENVNGGDYPTGFAGPALLADFDLSGSDATTSLEWMRGQNSMPVGQTDQLISGSAAVPFTSSMSYPTHQLSVQGSKGLNGKDYSNSDKFGLSWKSLQGLEDIGDYGTYKTALKDMHLAYADSLSKASYIFSLDDLVQTNGDWYFEEGSYETNNSYVANNSIPSLINTENVRQFAAPFFGGFNGNNILFKNPYNHARLELDEYERHTVEQAIEMVSSKDLANYELISMPGIINNRLNDKMISMVEDRGDALAILDLVGIYQSETDNGTELESTQSVSTIVQTINNEGYNSSYAATYYPNVIINDGVAITVPPSVAGIYAIATSEATSQPWFAPAGFNRGGVSNFRGARAKEILNKNDRDTLFLANINPVARFPATGDTVIYGQKTLQQTSSALDRINVRRLMIYLKKRIGVVADTILFDQNVRATWARFKSQAEPILSEVRSQFGITEYKLILDETTTTPDLQDRNIMYAKIYIKPARAIEFIAIDFVITQSGVEF